MEATALEDSAAMMLPRQDAKKNSVESSKGVPFAEEAKVEDHDQEATTTLQEISSVLPQDDNDSSHIFVPPRDVVAAPQQQSRPGAFPVSGPGFIPHEDSLLDIDTARATNEVPATLLNAVLVDDPEIPSASIVDYEAERKTQCHNRQGWIVLAAFVVTCLLVTVVVLAVVFTTSINFTRLLH